jgi:hypothetical protein
LLTPNLANEHLFIVLWHALVDVLGYDPNHCRIPFS